MTSWALEDIMSDSEQNSLHISADFSIPFEAKRAEMKTAITKTVEKKQLRCFPFKSKKRKHETQNSRKKI
jgi:hypothetical protein